MFRGIAISSVGESEGIALIVIANDSEKEGFHLLAWWLRNAKVNS